MALSVSDFANWSKNAFDSSSCLIVFAEATDKEPFVEVLNTHLVNRMILVTVVDNEEVLQNILWRKVNLRVNWLMATEDGMYSIRTDEL